MAKYYVTVQVEYSGEIEAPSRDEAENIAWTAWGDTMDSQLTYDSIYSIDVEELDDDEEEESEEEE